MHAIWEVAATQPAATHPARGDCDYYVNYMSFVRFNLCYKQIWWDLGDTRAADSTRTGTVAYKFLS